MEVYKRVYIKTADDLPPREKDSENSIIVFIGRNNTPEGGARYAFDTKEWFNDRFEIVNPDWYLCPVELPSEKEIEKAMTISTYIIKPNASPFELLSQGFKNGLNWLLSKLTNNE